MDAVIPKDAGARCRPAHPRVRSGSSSTRTDQSRSFARAFAAVVGAVLSTVAAVNWIANPWSYYSPRLFPPRVVDDRYVKCRLLREMNPPPQQLVLGSSRARGYPPTLLQERTGLRTFNASISGATPMDMLAFFRYAHESVKAPIRSVIVGVESPTFRGRAPNYSLVLANPELRRFVGPDSWRRRVWEAKSHLPHLLSPAHTIDSYRTIERTWMGKYSRTPAEPGIVTLPDGHEEPDRLERAPRPPGRKIQTFAREYILKNYREWEGMDPVGFRDLDALLRLLHRRGIKTTVVATPMHEAGRAVWRQSEMAAEEREALDRVEQLCRATGARFLDFSSTGKFGGDPDGFYDGVHPTPANIRKIMASMFPAAVPSSAVTGAGALSWQH